MRPMDARTRGKVKMATIIGGVVGFFIFMAAYAAAGSLFYLMFIFFGAAIGGATAWVMEPPSDD